MEDKIFAAVKFHFFFLTFVECMAVLAIFMLEKYQLEAKTVMI